MPRHHIQVRVFPAYRTMVPLAWLRKVAAEAMAMGGLERSAGAGVVIADDDTLRDLTRRFRGLDEVPDVLSFGSAAESAGESLEPGAGPQNVPIFPDVPAEDATLGEVIVSHPQAVRQAMEHGWAVERELALLVVHGILHLLGHDHAEPEEEAVMQGLEGKALGLLYPVESAGPRR